MNKFKTHPFISKVRSWIIPHLITSKTIQANVQFNLQDDTRHLFQFKNGAFNMITQKLEERTRKMYITEYLDYDYSPTRNESQIAAILKIFKEAMPDDETREGFLKWRGLSLTGNIEKKFMLLYGATGDNSKSMMSYIMLWAFPIYM